MFKNILKLLHELKFILTLYFDCLILVDGVVFNATFNNISVITWRSVLLVQETGVPRENHRPVANNWRTVSHNVVSSTPSHERSTLVWLFTQTETLLNSESKTSPLKFPEMLTYSGNTCFMCIWIVAIFPLIVGK